MVKKTSVTKYDNASQNNKTHITSNNLSYFLFNVHIYYGLIGLFDWIKIRRWNIIKQLALCYENKQQLSYYSKHKKKTLGFIYSKYKKKTLGFILFQGQEKDTLVYFSFVPETKVL